LFVLLTGTIVAVPGNATSYLGVVVGAVTFVLGLLVALAPGAHRIFGFTAFALAALSVPYTYGGLVVGAFLIILGGFFAVVWVPAPPGRSRAARPSKARPGP
jgi:hypothetical protein